MKNFLLFKHLLVSFALLISVPVFSQASLQWAKTYGNPSNRNDYVRGMVADDSGNVYVTGLSDSVNGTRDYVTIKYNASGTEQWVARYDGLGPDEPVAIAIDKSGNIYVTGYSQGFGLDYATIKYNNAGVQQWVARFNSYFVAEDRPSAMKLDKDGNVYVTGYADLPSSRNCATVKYNSSGVLQWVSYHSYSGAYAIAVDPVTSDIYVAGYAIRANGEDYITIKYNSAGVEQWARDYNGPANSYDYATAIALDPLGNVYVTGLARAPGPVYQVYEAATIKYNPSGSVQWIAYYSGPANILFQANAMVADKSGNIYITGTSDDSQYRTYCTTLKYNSEGVRQWVQFYNGSSDIFQYGIALAFDSQDNVYVAGESGNGPGKDNITIKYSPEGVQQWSERYDASAVENGAIAIAVNRLNEVFVTGNVLAYADNIGNYYDFATIKYAQSKPLIVSASPDTTIYYGYGSNCVLLKAEVSGGVSPYTFSWSPGVFFPNNQTTFACPTSTTTYSVIVKDALGTLDTAQVTIKVIDIRCGNQNEKILVCHNGQEICVAVSAVAAHLQHGDKLGSCSAGSNDCDKLKDLGNYKGKFPFIFKAYPNSFSLESIVIYQLPLDAQVTITLLDLNGREISTLVKEKKRAGYYVAFINGKRLIPGTYLCRMVISAPPCQSVHTLKLIVVK